MRVTSIAEIRVDCPYQVLAIRLNPVRISFAKINFIRHFAQYLISIRLCGNSNTKCLQNIEVMWINSIFVTLTFGMLFEILQFLFRYLNILLCKMTNDF